MISVGAFTFLSAHIGSISGKSGINQKMYRG